MSGEGEKPMYMICLDVEGVLLPEAWILLAEKTGIEALKRTTRDEPDYAKLMEYRFAILKENKITIDKMKEVITTMEPLEGAVEFVDWARQTTNGRVVLLTDTFETYARPLFDKLGNPCTFCHALKVDDEGYIYATAMRQENQKQKAVEAFKSLNFKILAAGDSYNDLTMIKAADHGFMFRPPASMAAENPDIPVATTHAELRALMEAAMK